MSSILKEKDIILIVDDNPTNLGVLFDFLTDSGFKVLVARTGESALQKVGYLIPDLILLDVIMPGIDGFETCRRLKANEATKDIPVIFMTALSETEQKVEGLNLGAVDYITKPLQHEEVLARVTVHLSLRNMSKKLQEQNVHLQQEIEQRISAESALRELTSELEKRVDERTAELSQSNQLLKQEITERLQAEAGLQQSEAQLRTQAKTLEQALGELQRTQLQMIQSEKMSSLGQLVAGLAHEINNPVNFIYGNVSHAHEYIQELTDLLCLYQMHYPKPVPEILDKIEAIDLTFLICDLPKLLSSMQVGVDRIRQIVMSLRNFSRLEESEMKPVDIHSGIDSTLLILQHRLKAKSDHPVIQVIKDYSSLPLVECYPGQLNQVFMNLLANAIDALEEQENLGDAPLKKPQIQICTEVIGGDNVRVTIADNGVGMAEKVSARVFDHFFTTKPVGKGTGMGLSISHQIVVEKHGGELKCISTPHQGTQFIIEIPIRQHYQVPALLQEA